jgi:transcriptional regulator with XRE-family HTH domain
VSTSLQAVREGRQLSRAAVARRLGLSEQTIYRMERGKTEVKDVHLIALASVYEVDVNTLKEAIAA